MVKQTARSLIAAWLFATVAGCGGWNWGGEPSDTAWQLKEDAARDVCSGRGCEPDIDADTEEANPVDARDTSGCRHHRECTGGERCYQGECTYDYPDGYFSDGGASDTGGCHDHRECTGGERCYQGECTYDYPDGYFSDGG